MGLIPLNSKLKPPNPGLNRAGVFFMPKTFVPPVLPQEPQRVKPDPDSRIPDRCPYCDQHAWLYKTNDIFEYTCLSCLDSAYQNGFKDYAKQLKAIALNLLNEISSMQKEMHQADQAASDTGDYASSFTLVLSTYLGCEDKPSVILDKVKNLVASTEAIKLLMNEKV